MKSGSEKIAADIIKKIRNAQSVSWNAKNTYYISGNGDDANDGKSPENPFLSPEKINDLELNPGDVVLFERNSVFRVTASIPIKNGVSYGAYGNGEKPQFLGSPYNFNKSDWFDCGNLIWKLDFEWDNLGTILINNGEIVGHRLFSIEDLKDDGDFYLDEQQYKLYLYCSQNPAHYDSVEISVGAFSMFSVGKNPGKVNNVNIDNLCIKLASIHGIWFFNSKDISVTNCEIAWIGGARQRGSQNPFQLFGNGLEFWDGGANIRAENNWLYQIYDAALTFQGAGQYDSITFGNNIIEYSTLSIEWWGRPRAEKYPTKKIKDISIKNNIVRMTGYGWGRKRRDICRDAHIVAGQGIYDYTDIVTNFIVEDNIFDCAYTYMFFHVWRKNFTKRIGIDYVFRNNSYYQRNRVGKDNLGYGNGKNGAFKFGQYDTLDNNLAVYMLPSDVVATYASNQLELENAVAAVDESPRLVKWLDS